MVSPLFTLLCPLCVAFFFSSANVFVHSVVLFYCLCIVKTTTKKGGKKMAPDALPHRLPHFALFFFNRTLCRFLTRDFPTAQGITCSG